MLLFGKTSHDLRLATLTAGRFIWRGTSRWEPKGQLKPKPGRRAEGCELSPDRQQEYCVKRIERLIKKLDSTNKYLRPKYLPTLTMTRPHLMRLIPAKLAYNVVSLFVPS
jgi:hypothetical protein